MIVRQAQFQGSILPGKDEAFRSYVTERLIPLWLQFPGVREVRVLHEVARDEGSQPVAMVLSMTYDDEAAMTAALESAVRFESRQVTQGLLAMFDGSVQHHVFRVAEALHRP